MTLSPKSSADSRKETGAAAYKKGAFAEIFAAVIFRLKGYKIIERRFRGPVGEIDVILRKGRALVFVEVKARKNLDEAKYSVTPMMKTRIEKAAQFFIARRSEYQSYECRFDVFVYQSPFVWEHLINCDF